MGREILNILDTIMFLQKMIIDVFYQTMNVTIIHFLLINQVNIKTNKLIKR